MPDSVKLLTGIVQKGHKRVLRGGSWINNGRNLRSANRNANTPDNRNNNIGLRLAGALWAKPSKAGGSVNQHNIQSRFGGQTTGSRCVSRQIQQYFAKHLPQSRFF